jgi:hypothetical protein
MSAARMVSIIFQKDGADDVESDDVVMISHNEDNRALYNLKMRSYNAKQPYEGLLSTNDMFRYVENLFWVALADEENGGDRIAHIQYNIPGFPSVVVSAETLKYDEDAYETFYEALKFWSRTL